MIKTMSMNTRTIQAAMHAGSSCFRLAIA